MERQGVVVGGNLQLIFTQSPDWTTLPITKNVLASLYDEWKPLKCISKYFLLIPAVQLVELSSKVQHWYIGDLDGQGRKFASEGDFVQ